MEHHLHFAAVGQHISLYFLFLIENNLAVVNNFTVRRLIQAQKRSSDRGFAAARFAHKTQGLAAADIERNIVYRLNDLLFAAASCGKVLLQVLHFNQFFSFTHSFPLLSAPLSAKASNSCNEYR